MALMPPGNATGVVIPPNPATPATLGDITNAKEYVERLSLSKRSGYPNAATDVEIGAAEAYKTAVIFSQNPAGNVAPAWLVNLNAMVQNINTTVQNLDITVTNLQTAVNTLNTTVQNILTDIATLRRRSEEMPILFANSQAGPRGHLYNPTVPLVGGWAPLMMAPNPVSRDALLIFTAAECITSAANLGLPILPAATPVAERRRQIANRIGVTID